MSQMLSQTTRSIIDIMTKHKKQKLNKKISQCTQAEHHLSMRFRSGKLDINIIDKIIVFTGPLIPVAVFFQAYNVWINSQTEGLSIITWSMLLFSSATMATYAIYHKTKPLMFTYIPLVIANTLVVSGIILL